MKKQHSSEAITGVILVLLSAFLFSAKAVLAKLVYREVPMTVIQLLVLRMLFSLPFYLGMLAWQWRKFNQEQPSGISAKSIFFPKEHLLATVLIGCLGYYISSLLDFCGLKFISAGLERVILFAYPTLVVIFGSIIFKTKIARHQIFALLISYIGIAIAFGAGLEQNKGAEIWKGGVLIFGCAITFSFYVLLSAKLIPKIGVGLFTSVAMLSATTGIFLHFIVAGNSAAGLLHFSPHVMLLMVLMAVFTTVVPSYFVSSGLKRIGSSNMAIISSIGPMITIAQAWYFLGEPFGWLQAIGTILVMVGVLMVSKKAEAVNE